MFTLRTRAIGLRRLNRLSTLTVQQFYAAMGFYALAPVTVPLGLGIEYLATQMERPL